MMNFDGPEVKAAFKEAFGVYIEDLTVDQIQVIVKLMKHARGRCRSNAALNNYLNRNFTGHRFKDVPVEGKDYERLEITPLKKAKE